MFSHINGFAHHQVNHVFQKIRTIDAPSEVTAWINRKLVKQQFMGKTPILIPACLCLNCEVLKVTVHLVFQL